VILLQQRTAVQAAERVAIVGRFVERLGLDLVAALLRGLCHG
jgi:hypothetical protein